MSVVTATVRGVRRRHDRTALLAAAVAVCRDEGLSALTFDAVGRRAGVPDRTVVYYFARKSELLAAVIGVMAHDLVAALDAGIDKRRYSSKELLRLVWPTLCTPSSRPVVRVWLELAVLGAAGEQPHRDAAQHLGELWLEWLSGRVSGRTRHQRAQRAAVLLARIDGALLLDHIGLHEAAAAAVAG